MKQFRPTAFGLTATLFLGLASIFSMPAALNAAAKNVIDFNRDIRPIFSENCYACHGPDKNKRKADLRLDIKEEAFKKLESGDYAIVPKQPGKSKLLQLVTTADEDDRMPPVKSGKKLTKDQIGLLRRWVEQGAEWQSHWSYIPPERPSLPKIKNKRWPKNDIDHFVLEKLEKNGLQPGKEVDRPTLIRRASLDLTGLPPTIEEVDAFLSDKSTNAYEKVVNRLLDSPHYGERMAVSWLDAARYADTSGYHFDSPRFMWLWRDWVINSFNHNKPFDEFTVEQLAGDLLPNPTRDQKTASGFHRNVMTNDEGGADPAEYSPSTLSTA
jgi:mono/diheme cytochrome c family protein